MSKLLKRITIHSEVCGGRLCIRGFEIQVSDVLDLLTTEISTEQALEAFPGLEVDDLRTALVYASHQINYPYSRQE